MSTTIGLTSEGPYIMKNVLSNNNTVVLPTVPTKQCHSELNNDTVKMVVKLPLISDTFVPNEEIIKEIINTVETDKMTSIKTIGDDLSLRLDYVIKNIGGEIVRSSVNLTKVELSNFILLCDSIGDNKLLYRTGRKIKAKALIDIPKDKSFGIRYNRHNENYTIYLTGVTISGNVLNTEKTFDNVTENKYFNKIMELQEGRLPAYKKAHDRFRHSHLHHRNYHLHEIFNNGDCNHYVGDAKYDSDKSAILESSLDIFTNNMLQSLYDKPIYVEFSNTLSKIVVDIEIFIDYVEIDNISDLEELVIANKAELDGVDLNGTNIDTNEGTDINPNPNIDDPNPTPSTGDNNNTNTPEYGGNSTDSENTDNTETEVTDTSSTETGEIEQTNPDNVSVDNTESNTSDTPETTTENNNI